jgi:NAD(P)H-dependent FMN reductase
LPKIGVILSTTRPNRFADKPAGWFLALARARTDLTFELIDLRDYPLPFFDEVTTDLHAPSTNEVARRWQAKLAECDGFVIITAEYNHAPPGVLKNAIDFAYKPWIRKPVAYVGYGAVGAARAVQQLKEIAVELQMAPLKVSIHLQGADFVAVYRGEKTLDDLAYLPPLVTRMLDELAWWTDALKVAREASRASRTS